PRDNIRSVLNRVHLPGNTTAVHPRHWDTIENGETWRMIVEGRLPIVPGQNYIEKLAHRWTLGAKLFHKHQDKVQLIRYEDFSKDKAGSIYGLSVAVGLKPIHRIDEFVDEQFQPRGDRDVRWNNFFGEHNLKQIEAICATEMRQFSYVANSQVTAPR